MKKIIIWLLIVTSFTSFAREPIEWLSVYWYDANKNKLPRILLIGDSICKGYQREVKKELKGIAYTSYYATSKCVTDSTYLRELAFILDEYDYAVIQFNNGLHSLNKDPEKWEAGLRKAIKLIREKEKNAKIIWASSTPVKIPKYMEKVKILNKTALRVIKENNIPVNDLFTLMSGHMNEDIWSDQVHYNVKGKVIQGKQIAELIKKALRK